MTPLSVERSAIAEDRVEVHQRPLPEIGRGPLHPAIPAGGDHGEDQIRSILNRQVIHEGQCLVVGARDIAAVLPAHEVPVEACQREERGGSQSRAGEPHVRPPPGGLLEPLGHALVQP